jgi:hypothetical protein
MNIMAASMRLARWSDQGFKCSEDAKPEGMLVGDGDGEGLEDGEVVAAVIVVDIEDAAIVESGGGEYGEGMAAGG